MQMHDCFAYSMAGVRGARPMSSKTYNKRKGALLPKLRARTDPPPRRMRAGEGRHDAWHANLRQLLERTGGTLVRGFRLLKLQVDPAMWLSTTPWLATAHAVVATISPSGTTVYTDPNALADQSDEYIFVPSTRAHSELTDAQLISGDWHLGSVVGGSTLFEMRFIAHEKLQGRAKSVVASDPDALVAKPCVSVRLPPHFAEWCRVNQRGGAMDILAEMMGAPVFPCNEPTRDDAEVVALDSYSAATRSGEACVDGLHGLKLEFQCRERLLRGEMSIAEARRCFFDYFDATYETLRLTQTRRFAEWCPESRLQASKSAQGACGDA